MCLHLLIHVPVQTCVFQDEPIFLPLLGEIGFSILLFPQPALAVPLTQVPAGYPPLTDGGYGASTCRWQERFRNLPNKAQPLRPERSNKASNLCSFSLTLTSLKIVQRPAMKSENNDGKQRISVQPPAVALDAGDLRGRGRQSQSWTWTLPFGALGWACSGWSLLLCRSSSCFDSGSVPAKSPPLGFYLHLQNAAGSSLQGQSRIQHRTQLVK